MGAQSKPTGPDLTQGIPDGDLSPGGMLTGHVGEAPVLLARSGADVFAIDAACTHYGAPLADGLIAGETVRCPWHHACFSLRTGEAQHAPAFAPLARWKVKQVGGRIVVRERIAAPARAEVKHSVPTTGQPRRIVIVGGGAAGFAAIDTLRRSGYAGSIIVLSAEDTPPVDRPNPSKDYLAGHAPEAWLPLRPDSYYAENDIDLRLSTTVTNIDVRNRQVVLHQGDRIPYDRLLLATGAEPVRLSIPGADQAHVHVLRALADCKAIIAGASTTRSAVILGAGFIGLEAAAALRTRGLGVHVVAPEQQPMERILGPRLGSLVRTLHKYRGVTFHLGDVADAIERDRVVLTSGNVIEADLVVVGVGVRPRTQLAERAGLAVDRGVVVNAHLETSAPHIYAAGDIARWPDARTGANIRVEHWAVAERQGQTAARNMLGAREKFLAVPFFWSQHYDTSISYVGHADTWDEIAIDGDPASDCIVRYKARGRLMAVASINRDRESLEAELVMEQQSAG